MKVVEQLLLPVMIDSISGNEPDISSREKILYINRVTNIGKKERIA